MLRSYDPDCVRRILYGAFETVHLKPSEPVYRVDFADAQILTKTVHQSHWHEIPASFLQYDSYSLTLMRAHAFAFVLPAILDFAIRDPVTLDVGNIALQRALTVPANETEERITLFSALTAWQRIAVRRCAELFYYRQSPRPNRWEPALQYWDVLPEDLSG